jgi:hypothetical protein
MAVFWVALMMVVARTSEKLVRRYNPEDSHFVLTAVRTSNPTQNVMFYFLLGSVLISTCQ